MGHKHYGDSFCETLGTIVKTTQLVNDPATIIHSKNQHDEDIKFFMKANPNYAQGHGLLTIAPLNMGTFTKVLKRQYSSVIRNSYKSAIRLFEQFQTFLVMRPKYEHLQQAQ